MGYGSLEDKVKEAEKRFSNIHFQPAVKPSEVLSYSRSADVGLSLIENTCLSYYLTLANKVVEYIVSGVPVITTNFPEPNRIVQPYQCGWMVEANKKAIKDLIENISKKEIKEKKDNALKCGDNFSWKSEERKLLSAYHGII
jgi:glycosyltransferase involved in cell wall biosynthesis